MRNLSGIQQRVWQLRCLPVAATAAVVALLGGIIFFGAAHLRHKVRGQILNRDAEVLHAVALARQMADETYAGLGGQIEHFADQFAVALQISQVRGVVAARLFDAQGKLLTAFPAHVTATSLDAGDVESLQVLRPLSRFHPEAALKSVFVESPPSVAPPETAFPLLEVTIPFHRSDQTNLLGAVQFVMDGRSIAAEFATLDRHLFWQAGLAFVGGGVLVVVALGWTFGRLQLVNRQLADRTDSLLRANEELAMAARTCAVGAVTSHLIHSLSSPLTGLQNFLATGGREVPPASDPAWRQAALLTRKMQETIAEVVRVLREHQGAGHYQISVAELGGLTAKRMEPASRQAGVTCRVRCATDGEFSNREANLVLLILENLLKNAIEATPAGKAVELLVHSAGDTVRFEVRDQGPGFPAELRSSLFQPCRSTKAEGSGIGLAICKQLANHLEADLELTESAASGAVFTLSLPVPMLAPGSTSAKAASPVKV